MILGTAAYMAPEQARGKPVDKRADIWAFGCVLYEMLTGRRRSSGDTVTDVLAAVVTPTTPTGRAAGGAAAARPRTSLRRCLEKDPRRRFRDIGDVRFELEECRTPRAAATAAAPAAAPAAAEPTRPARRRSRGWAVPPACSPAAP